MKYIHIDNMTTIEAIQWTGKNGYEISRFAPDVFADNFAIENKPANTLHLECKEIDLNIVVNDWLIKSSDGIYFSYSNDSFLKYWKKHPDA